MPKSVVLFCGFWYSYSPFYHSNFLFIYSDNDASFGKDGQSVIRDSPNAIGIPTMKFPASDPTAFYTDLEFEQNKSNIDKAIQLIRTSIPIYMGIILPESGIGTGLAKLEVNAPKTYEYLSQELESLVDYVKNYSE